MKKKILIIIVILLALVMCIISILSFIRYKDKKELLKDIKNSYSDIVSVTSNKKIYVYEEDTYKEIGIIYNDTIIPLVEKEISDTEDIYYQIENTNYYIDYKDIKKVNNYQEDISLDHYLVTKKIKTSKTNLYQDNELKIKLDQELEFDVLSVNDGKYYVKYLGDIYYIKDNYELVNIENVENLKDISVLNFSNDISNSKFEEVIKYLSDNKYESIAIDDFKLWIYGNVSLEKNKVLLLSYKKLNNEQLNILEKYNLSVCTDLDNIKFVSGDSKLKVGDKKYYKYEINSNTTLNRVKDMLKGIKEVKITNNATSIAVLNYHFFYDGAGGEVCDEGICLDTSNFRKQLDYLKENGYKTLTMKEFNDWMDKKITLPKKSVLLTIDDGAMGTSFINGNKLIPILEEYKMHASLFLITAWWDINNYKSEYLEVYSHGNNLHESNYCNNNGCGAKGVKLSKEELINDLNKSVNILGTNLAFCYPFYQMNNTMVEALKQTGFKVAFVGGNKKAKQSDYKYAVPRYVIYKGTSLNNFINMIK